MPLKCSQGQDHSTYFLDNLASEIVEELSREPWATKMAKKILLQKIMSRYFVIVEHASILKRTSMSEAPMDNYLSFQQLNQEKILAYLREHPAIFFEEKTILQLHDYLVGQKETLYVFRP